MKFCDFIIDDTGINRNNNALLNFEEFRTKTEKSEELSDKAIPCNLNDTNKNLISGNSLNNIEFNNAEIDEANNANANITKNIEDKILRIVYLRGKIFYIYYLFF